MIRSKAGIVLSERKYTEEILHDVRLLGVELIDFLVQGGGGDLRFMND